MNKENITIGQTWQRKDGKLVKITDERTSRGLREFELTPVEKGRKSWKWDGAIYNELEFVPEIKN